MYFQKVISSKSTKCYKRITENIYSHYQNGRIITLYNYLMCLEFFRYTLTLSYEVYIIAHVLILD